MSSTLKAVITSTLKPLMGAVLGASVNQIIFKLIQLSDYHDVGRPFIPPLIVPKIVNVGLIKKAFPRACI